MVFNNIKFDSYNHAKFSSLLNRFGFDYEYKKTIFTTTLGEVSSHFVVKLGIHDNVEWVEHIFIAERMSNHIDMKCEQISNQTGANCTILVGDDFKTFERLTVGPTKKKGFMNCEHVNPQRCIVDKGASIELIRGFESSDEYWAVYSLLRTLSGNTDWEIVFPSYHDFIGSVL